MTTEPTTTNQPADMWATVELMGHAQTAGRISRPSDWGGLLRVDVPEGEDFRTEFYGMPAIYSIKLVSEQIARAYARPNRSVVAYDTPIVTREQHEAVVNRLQNHENDLRMHIRELEKRLTAVNALPLVSDRRLDEGDEDREVENPF
jgi:hypothetical protein